MKPMGYQQEISSESGRKFYIMELESVKGTGIIVYFYDQEIDEGGFFHVIYHNDLETLTIDERVSVTDEMGNHGEHTTKDYVIPYDAWLEDVSTEHLISILDVQIKEALEDAIKTKSL